MKPYQTIGSTLTPDGGTLTLHEHDGNYEIRLDGYPLMSTVATASELLLAKLGCGNLKRVGKPRVLIGGLGLGFTLKGVLDIAGKRTSVEVAELLPEVVDWNRNLLSELNGSLLDDPRVEVLVEDVFDVLARVSEPRYNSILLDVDNGPTAMMKKENSRLYDHRCFSLVASALKPYGRAAFWSAAEDRIFSRRLRKAGFNVEAVGAKAYEKAKRNTHTIYVAERR